MNQPGLHIDRLRQTAAYQEMLENRRRAALEHERVRRRIFVACVASFAFWTLAAVLISAWGMSTVTLARYSYNIIEAGVLLGLAGIASTAVFAYGRLGG